jgi:hypothetical protein
VCLSDAKRGRDEEGECILEVEPVFRIRIRDPMLFDPGIRNEFLRILDTHTGISKSFVKKKLG